jgi:hypothetical protein
MRALRLTAAAQEALRPRARAQVADNVRAVRDRVRRHLAGVEAGPRQPDFSGGPLTGYEPRAARAGETPAPPITSVGGRASSESGALPRARLGPVQVPELLNPCWRGDVPRAAALAGRPDRDETASPTRFLIENPARLFASFVLENWPVLVWCAAMVVCTLPTFFGFVVTAKVVGAVLLVGGSAAVLIGVRAADKLQAPRIPRRR